MLTQQQVLSAVVNLPDSFTFDNDPVRQDEVGQILCGSFWNRVLDPVLLKAVFNLVLVEMLAVLLFET